MTPRILSAVFAAVLGVLAASGAAAATVKCTEIGNVLHCSDGSRGTKVGNVWYHVFGEHSAETQSAATEDPPPDRSCLRIGNNEFCAWRGNDACRIVDGRPFCDPVAN
jgi:opacity protein-like surface antigen